MADIWFREEGGTWVAFVSDAPRIEARGLTKAEALGRLVALHADSFLIHYNRVGGPAGAACDYPIRIVGYP
jgi:hypothetical protein